MIIGWTEPSWRSQATVANPRRKCWLRWLSRQESNFFLRRPLTSWAPLFFFLAEPAFVFYISTSRFRVCPHNQTLRTPQGGGGGQHHALACVLPGMESVDLWSRPAAVWGSLASVAPTKQTPTDHENCKALPHFLRTVQRGICFVTARQSWVGACASCICCFLSTSVLLAAVEVPCQEYTYKCRNNHCVSKKNPECDGEKDCSDNSDEDNCSE